MEDLKQLVQICPFFTPPTPDIHPSRKAFFRNLANWRFLLHQFDTREKADAFLRKIKENPKVLEINAAKHCAEKNAARKMLEKLGIAVSTTSGRLPFIFSNDGEKKTPIGIDWKQVEEQLGPDLVASERYPSVQQSVNETFHAFHAFYTNRSMHDGASDPEAF